MQRGRAGGHCLRKDTFPLTLGSTRPLIIRLESSPGKMYRKTTMRMVDTVNGAGP